MIETNKYLKIITFDYQVQIIKKGVVLDLDVISKG